MLQQRRKSIDCIELLKVVEEGDLRKIDAFMEQLREFYNNIDLYSTVAHLVLQLSICYDHSSIVEPLINQYKVFYQYTFMYQIVHAMYICSHVVHA